MSGSQDAPQSHRPWPLWLWWLGPLIDILFLIWGYVLLAYHADVGGTFCCLIAGYVLSQFFCVVVISLSGHNRVVKVFLSLGSLFAFLLLHSFLVMQLMMALASV